MYNKILLKRGATQASLLAGGGGYNVGEVILALDTQTLFVCVSATAAPTSFIALGKASDDALKLAIANNLSDLNNVGTARTNLSVYSKSEVDNLLSGLAWKQSVRVATTANITLSAPQTIDGIALVAGDRVLVKNQTLPVENGIYVVGAAAWTRAADANIGSNLDAASCFVEQGTVNADSAWVLTTDLPIVVGTTAITFVQFSGTGQINAGIGLVKTGNTLAIDFTDTELVSKATPVAADQILIGDSAARNVAKRATITSIIPLFASLDTKKVKVSATDTTEGYLGAKLITGATNTGITKTINNPAGNESIQLDIDVNAMTTLATSVAPATDLLAGYIGGSMKKITIQNAVKDVVIDGGSF